MRKDQRSIIKEIDISVSKGLKWLKEQQPDSIKDISRSIQALSSWDKPAPHLIEKLLLLERNGSWETETQINDTARALIALHGCGNDRHEVVRWILEQQSGDCWNESEIDTAYALIALGDCGIRNEAGCEWLVQNYGQEWVHAGTTSLIITALIKQDRKRFHDFIDERAAWLLSIRENGGWTYIATSNLAIQALILSGIKETDIYPSIKWLQGKQLENGSWKDITSTSLSLVSMRMYLDKLNSISNE